MTSNKYDILIVGAGVAGSALAHALSSSSLRIALLERSLSEPDRIVGELLQPAGVLALRNLGLEHCLDGIDAIPVKGYYVVETSQSRNVQIPYLPGTQGRSFHHGRFIMKLREAARQAPGVTVLEATVNELIQTGRKVIGVKATLAGQSQDFFADMVIVADGCFSNFRPCVMPPSPTSIKPVTKSHFVGLVLEDATLPCPQHGTVGLVQKSGPVLLYQIGQRDTRLLVDIRVPLPADLKTHILTNIVPQLPSSLHRPIQIAIEKDRLRRMPNSFLPPVNQADTGGLENVFLIGDAYNMRHPLTGGGMTVAFNDVVLLRELLLSQNMPINDWKVMKRLLAKWFKDRKKLASSINILSVALYDLFSAESSELSVLREGCFKYFELGGECVTGPIGLLSGVTPSPFLLFRHFFTVAFYSIWVMFISTPHKQQRTGIMACPALIIRAFKVFFTACIVFTPLLWTEMRLWTSRSTSGIWLAVLFAIFAIVAFAMHSDGRLDHVLGLNVLDDFSRKVYDYSGYNVSLVY